MYSDILAKVVSGEMTLKSAVEAAGALAVSVVSAEPSSSNNFQFLVGKKVFIRTVSYHYTGKVKSANKDFIVLQDAAWVADSGRFAAALSKGSLSEVEPYPNECIVMTPSVVDISEWAHDLPRKTL
jgi:hypothetical protein